MSNSWKMFIFLGVFQTFLQTADFKVVLKTRNKDVILPTISPPDQNKTIERTLQALEGLLDFFQREHKNLIIDGVFGLRVLEGIVKKILADEQGGKMMLPSKLRTSLKKLHSRCKNIAKKSIYFMKKNNPHYFDVVGFVAVEPWQSIYPLRNLKLNVAVPHHVNMSDDKIKMKESEQDRCIRSLAGDKKNGIKPCTVSEYCWKMNTVQGKSGYHLTHQLLFFMMGEAKGCLKVFETKLKSDSYEGGVDEFLSQSCQLMYHEMLQQKDKAIEKKYLEDIDLYMEQCVVCGMLGYAEFFSLHHLNLILGWIHPSRGCFGIFEDIRSAPPSDDDEEEEEKSNGNKKTMRQLKMAKDLEDGCEVHSTGVGTGLLAHYLRWLLYISRFTTPKVNPHAYDKAGFFLKHKYLGVIPSVKTTLMFVIIVILVLIIVAKRLGFRIPKYLWM